MDQTPSYKKALCQYKNVAKIVIHMVECYCVYMQSALIKSCKQPSQQLYLFSLSNHNLFVSAIPLSALHNTVLQITQFAVWHTQVATITNVGQKGNTKCNDTCNEGLVPVWSVGRITAVGRVLYTQGITDRVKVVSLLMMLMLSCHSMLKDMTILHTG